MIAHFILGATAAVLIACSPMLFSAVPYDRRVNQIKAASRAMPVTNGGAAAAATTDQSNAILSNTIVAPTGIIETPADLRVYLPCKVAC